MKKIIFILLLALATTVSHAQTHTGDLTLTTQEEVNAFSFMEVTGNLNINDAVDNNITNLDSLIGLTRVGGNLLIGGYFSTEESRGNKSLMSLAGLDSLTEVGGSLRMIGNTSLATLSNLRSLTEVGRHLFIYETSLTSLEGLDALTEIGENLNINNNPLLTSLAGLEALDSIGGNLSVNNNVSLTNLCLLPSLVGDENQITSGKYFVSGNSYNPSYVAIQVDPTCMITEVRLTSQAEINAFTATEVIGSLVIEETSPGNITSLSNLSSLTSIGSELRIRNNTALTSLGGLEMLNAIGGNITIQENTALVDFCSLSSLVRDESQITSRKYFVSDNGYNPPYSFIQNENLCNNATGGIFDGDITLESQDTIDNFNYRFITGDLIINDSLDNTITNLNGLSDLTEIGGDLQIFENDSLSSLSGLEALTEIGGDLEIFENATLTSLSGLDALTDIGGTLYIGNNVTLTSLSGLETLTKVGEYLIIDDNNSLTSLSGLDALTEIGGFLSISRNATLTSLSGLGALTEIRGNLSIISGRNLSIINNVSLTDLCILSSLVGDENQITSGEYFVSGNEYNPPYSFIQNENLCSNANGGIFDGDLTLTTQEEVNAFSFMEVTGTLTINDAVDNNITNLDSLIGLTRVGGDLLIGGGFSTEESRGNKSLMSLAGLDSLTEVGRTLRMIGNTSLTTLSNLRSLTEVGRHLYIYETSLTSLEGLNALAKVGEQFGVGISFEGLGQNALLTSLAGLDALTEIGGGLSINNNPALTSLTGLEALDSIGRSLSINNNPALTSLTGLEALDSIGRSLSIRNNVSLTDLCILSSLVGDENQITSGEYFVNGNGYNPSYAAIQVDPTCMITEVRLTSQAEINAFATTEVIGSLVIEETSPGNITSLSNLSSLTSIGSELRIRNNTALTSLGGLEMLNAIGGNITIQENTALVDFCSLSSLVRDESQITSREYFVSDNGYNPPYSFIQNENLCNNATGGIFVGDITLESQDTIDNFNYTFITGDLTINDSLDNTITNLNGLSDLTKIGGDLQISENDSLTSLSGLEALTEIGGDLEIFENATLTSLSGLGALTEIRGNLSIISGRNLSIINNVSLTDLCILSSLVGDENQITSGEYFVSGNEYNPPYSFIQNENLCSNANGGIFVGDITLESQDTIDNFNYRFITGDLTINDSLDNTITNLNGLSDLTEIGGDLQIFENATLTSLSGLEALTEIGGFLQILDNATLTSLSGLEALTEIGGDLNINTNATLTSLSGLGSLTEIGGPLDIRNNATLTSLSGLEALTEIGGDLQIQSNDSLMSLSGLSSLTEIGGGLNIQNNTALPSLSGLESLTEIGGGLNIQNNTALPSLSGLESLTEIGGDLQIFENATLTSLSGLEALTEIGGVLQIFNNATLTDFCAISYLVGDESQITINEYTVFNNSDNPTYEEIQTIPGCNPPVVVVTLPNISIQSGEAFSPINLGSVFSDPNGDVLSYTVASSDTAIITAALSGDMLTLTEVDTGTAMITVTASDGDLSVSDEFMVTVTNTAPMVDAALADVTIESGAGFEVINISAVFSDANGDVLNYTVASSDTAIITAALSGDTLTLTEVGKGTAMITVTASDGDLSVSDEFMGSITNTAPTVATALTDVTIESGAGFEVINISAVFSDANGDVLNYTVASSDTAIITAALSGDTLTLTEVGTGTAMITVTASDGDLSVSDEFMVTVTNTAPMVNAALTDVTIESGAGFEVINISAVFSDANGDVLSYTVASSDTAIITAALSGDTLTLTEVSKGTAMITVTASDGDLSVSDEFMGSITNTAPTVATALTDVTIESGAGFEVINISAVFSDANGDVLSYTVASSDTAIITAALSGDMLTLTEVSKGTAMITVTASDGDLSVSDEFMGSVTNTAPMVNAALTDVTIESGASFEVINISAVFSDANGDVLSYTVASSDTAIITAALSGNILTLTEVGTGTAMITVTATDPGGLFVSNSFTVTVEEGALGIADTDILAVYPNPSSGVFELSRTVDVVSVYDMSGRLVYRGSNIKQLDLTSQQSGQYLVEVGVGKERGKYTVIRE